MKAKPKKSRRPRAETTSSRRKTTGTPKHVFPEVVAAVQKRWVLPHCPSCARPCCDLETLVLEFTWRQLRLLWGIRKPRREFDERLAQGKGPEEIRTQDGMYYVHKKVCPAYRDGRCSVYDSDLKPAGCTDFPIYLDEAGGLIADLRCEALSLDRVEAELRARLPAGAPVRRRAHPEFPFLVTFPGAARNRPARRRNPRGRKRRP